jgi:hypothetical protein
MSLFMLCDDLLEMIGEQVELKRDPQKDARAYWVGLQEPDADGGTTPSGCSSTPHGKMMKIKPDPLHSELCTGLSSGSFVGDHTSCVRWMMANEVERVCKFLGNMNEMATTVLYGHHIPDETMLGAMACVLNYRADEYREAEREFAEEDAEDDDMEPFDDPAFWGEQEVTPAFARGTFYQREY